MSGIAKLYDPRCALCPGCRGSRHVCFGGVGAAPTKLVDILVVGDAPSIEEDLEGIPHSFSDDRAKILRNALKSAGLFGGGAHVYATYAHKCCPHGKVQLKNMKVCVENYLKKEIALLKPRVIVLLGKSVQQTVAGLTQPLSKTHGKLIEYAQEGHTCKAFVVEHPFAILSSPAKYKGWVADLSRLRAVLAGDGSPFWESEKLGRFHFTTIESISKLREVVDALLEDDAGDYLAFDVEASGLDNELFKDDFKLYSIQFGVVDQTVKEFNSLRTVYFLPVQSEQFACCKTPGWRKKVREELTRLLGPTTTLKPIAHSSKYDQKVLWKFGVPVFVEWDTLMLWANLHGEAPLSLKEIAYQVTDLGGYEREMEVYFKNKGTYDALPEILIPYGCLDIVITRHLMYELHGSILQDILPLELTDVRMGEL